MVCVRIDSAAQVNCGRGSDGDAILAVVYSTAVGQDVDVCALWSELAVTLCHGPQVVSLSAPPCVPSTHPPLIALPLCRRDKRRRDTLDRAGGTGIGMSRPELWLRTPPPLSGLPKPGAAKSTQGEDEEKWVEPRATHLCKVFADVFRRHAQVMAEGAGIACLTGALPEELARYMRGVCAIGGGGGSC